MDICENPLRKSMFGKWTLKENILKRRVTVSYCTVWSSPIMLTRGCDFCKTEEHERIISKIIIAYLELAFSGILLAYPLPKHPFSKSLFSKSLFSERPFSKIMFSKSPFSKSLPQNTIFRLSYLTRFCLYTWLILRVRP